MLGSRIMLFQMSPENNADAMVRPRASLSMTSPGSQVCRNHGAHSVIEKVGVPLAGASSWTRFLMSSSCVSMINAEASNE